MGKTILYRIFDARSLAETVDGTSPRSSERNDREKILIRKFRKMILLTEWYRALCGYT
jgi:hypothetical protein